MINKLDANSADLIGSDGCSEWNIAAIVVGFNQSNHLSRVVTALCGQTPKINTIICVDNSDVRFRVRNRGICDAAAETGCQVIYCEMTANMGSAGGFAVGMALALNSGADWVWLNDQDGEPQADCLPGLLRAARELNIKGVIAPRVISYDGKNLNYFRGRRSLFGNSILIKENEKLRIERIDFAGTTGIFINSKVIRECGFFDYNNFFVGIEDIEYCYRIKRKGFLAYIVKDAVYKHPDIYKKLNLKGPMLLSGLVPRYFGTDPVIAEKVSSVCFNYETKAVYYFSLVYSLIRLLFDKIEYPGIALKMVVRAYLRGARKLVNDPFNSGNDRIQNISIFKKTRLL